MAGSRPLTLSSPSRPLRRRSAGLPVQCREGNFKLLPQLLFLLGDGEMAHFFFFFFNPYIDKHCQVLVPGMGAVYLHIRACFSSC